jgi:hypothetical protein
MLKLLIVGYLVLCIAYSNVAISMSVKGGGSQCAACVTVRVVVMRAALWLRRQLVVMLLCFFVQVQLTSSAQDIYKVLPRRTRFCSTISKVLRNAG